MEETKLRKEAKKMNLKLSGNYASYFIFSDCLTNKMQQKQQEGTAPLFPLIQSILNKNINKQSSILVHSETFSSLRAEPASFLHIIYRLRCFYLQVCSRSSEISEESALIYQQVFKKHFWKTTVHKFIERRLAAGS